MAGLVAQGVTEEFRAEIIQISNNMLRDFLVHYYHDCLRDLAPQGRFGRTKNWLQSGESELNPGGRSRLSFAPLEIIDLERPTQARTIEAFVRWWESTHSAQRTKAELGRGKIPSTSSEDRGIYAWFGLSQEQKDELSRLRTSGRSDFGAKDDPPQYVKYLQEGTWPHPDGRGRRYKGFLDKIMDYMQVFVETMVTP